MNKIIKMERSSFPLGFGIVAGLFFIIAMNRTMGLIALAIAYLIESFVYGRHICDLQEEVLELKEKQRRTSKGRTR